MLLGCSLAGARAVEAQASSFVPVGAPVYRDIDLLTNAGLIDTVAAGIRPYTKREIQRLLAEAQRNLDRRGSSVNWAEEMIERDMARHAEAGKAVDYAALDVAEMDSPFRPVPKDFNGSIDAAIDPLADWRQGRLISDGLTTGIETVHSAVLGKHMAVALSPRVTLEDARSRTTITTVKVQQANATFLFGNLLVDAGRDYVVFGPAPSGGLLLSMNAPPLDMIRVSTQRPAALPWVLRHLGLASGTLLVADLGTDRQIHAHSKLVAYRFAIAPHRNLEFGVAVLDETGGRGAPPGSFADRVLDAIPPIDALRTGSDFQFSNKLAGVDARWRIPAWAGLEVYLDGAVDDMDIRRLRSSLLQDGGVVGGISLACLVECGRLAARLEYHQTGIRYYTHTDFGSGIQAHGIMLGDPLGPRGLGGYATLESNVSAVGKLSITGGYEVRSGNLYGSAGQGSRSKDFHFVQIEHRPGERRARVVTSWTSHTQGGRADMVLSAGVERAKNFNFSGASRTSSIAQIAYQLWP